MLIEAGSQSSGSELFYQRHWRLWLWPRGRAGPAVLAVMAAPVTLGYGPLVSGWPYAAAVPAPLRLRPTHTLNAITAFTLFARYIYDTSSDTSARSSTHRSAESRYRGYPPYRSLM
jgi:hypothetical protein